jgi:peptide-methionine (S)-S-oxide reductase
MNRRIRNGDIVTIDLDLKPENGFVPEPLFDSSGRISLVVGWGNYLPGVHELLLGCRVGDNVRDVSIDAGYGERSDDLIFAVPRDQVNKLMKNWKPGQQLVLGGAPVEVLSYDKERVVIDANCPLAGSSYLCSFTVDAVDKAFEKNSFQKRDDDVVIIPVGRKTSTDEITLSKACPDRYQVATFALGCFWGAELAFMRTPGVLSTRVGYSTGWQKKRETVMVVFDAEVVSFENLVKIALSRSWEAQDAFTNATLSQNAEKDDFGLVDLFGQDENSEVYANAIYYRNEGQRVAARKVLETARYKVDLLPARTFHDAAESDQQYLYKGGQSTRKNERIKIRCYG